MFSYQFTQAMKTFEKLKLFHEANRMAKNSNVYTKAISAIKYKKGGKTESRRLCKKIGFSKQIIEN